MYYLTPIRVAAVETTKSRTDVGKFGPFQIVGEICKMVCAIAMENSMKVLQNTKK